jgi:hypothetical protein
VSKERDERIARTESLFRGVNERIAETAARFGAEDASFVCECADPHCTERVRATLADYEQVRADGARFILAPGHELAEVERVTRESKRFEFVEKVKPRIRKTAERLDPRAQEA